MTSRLYTNERIERRAAAAASGDGGLNHHQQAWLREFLEDAEKSPRLSAWEFDFVSSIWDRFRRFGAEMRVSQEQWAVLRRIEEKIHAAG